MAPATITEDYYNILQVTPTATTDAITKSFRQLALQLHPDRNIGCNTTAAFQLLGQAYDTLKDASKRRAYDVIYPSIKKPHSTGASTSSSSSNARPSGATSEAAQIAVLQKAKQDRQRTWHIKKNVLDSSIFERRRDIRKLEQEIKNLDSIAAAEAAVEAQKKSWTTWMLSPLYRQPELSDEQKARQDIERQERRVEKDLKERKLTLKRATMQEDERALTQGQESVNAADWLDDSKI